VVRRIAAFARDRGRTVHLLQWDVARLPFDTPAILARHPEVDGVTHAAIRVAVGAWARAAVRRWHETYVGPTHMLIGETPLAGERLMELARPRDDAVEPLLASDATLFVVPVPSRDVRRAIEEARAKEMSHPMHARDAASAPPHLVRAHWEELERVAAELGIARSSPVGTYDPDLYAQTYLRVLRHRHVTVAPTERVLTIAGSAHAPAAWAAEIVPTAEEVAAAMREVERMDANEIERRAEGWYRA
jgi:hypothetical protein